MLPRFHFDVLEGEPGLIPNASRRRRITGAIFREDRSERGNTQSSRERHSWGRPTPSGASGAESPDLTAISKDHRWGHWRNEGAISLYLGSMFVILQPWGVIRREAIATRGGLVAAELEAEAIPSDLNT